MLNADLISQCVYKAILPPRFRDQAHVKRACVSDEIGSDPLGPANLMVWAVGLGLGLLASNAWED